MRRRHISAIRVHRGNFTIAHHSGRARFPPNYAPISFHLCFFLWLFFVPKLGAFRSAQSATLHILARGRQGRETRCFEIRKKRAPLIYPPSLGRRRRRRPRVYSRANASRPPRRRRRQRRRPQLFSRVMTPPGRYKTAPDHRISYLAWHSSVRKRISSLRNSCSFHCQFIK